MSLRSLWTLVGAAWGAVIGIPATILVGGFLLGAAWLFLFGDDPWPVGSWLVLLPAMLLGAAIFIGGLGVGYRYGVRAEAGLAGDHSGPAPESERAAALSATRLRRRAWWLIGLAALVGLIQLGAVSAMTRGQQAERDRGAELRANFERLVGSRHAISGIEIVAARGAQPDARSVTRAAISLEGRRSGRYRIAWELTETLHDTPLQVGEDRLTLVSGDTVVFVAIDFDTVRERYRREVLGGRGGVLVESEWPFRARIKPVLSRAEADSIPRNELQNLRLGTSALISEGEAPVPVYFRID